MKKVICGSEMDRMPDFAFKMMAFLFNVTDVIKSPAKRLDPFKILKGQTVIDYGSGTGRYIKQASELVGESGTVYPVDIQPLAIESAFRQIEKHNLKNVKPVQTDGKTVNIPSNSADIIYCLDMFHMVRDTNQFLKELHRLTKEDGKLYLEDGHQPRLKTKEKILNSGCWKIIEESGSFITCKPKTL
jgi:ubiquinone/menaquinone biosynthesis C-methylase UbiE